ncbi:hypothetical protein, partial [Alkalibacillus haloalkaliphilus]|uniref:hypothetical protein n=1 Tax=Alkalibacillus haloalkaliphilus TaxID=94136 RepID=UPI002936AAE8
SRTRAAFQWPVEPCIDDRLFVVFPCIRKSGFDSVGDFLTAIFSLEIPKISSINIILCQILFSIEDEFFGHIKECGSHKETRKKT